jgi:hypothetical protein
MKITVTLKKSDENMTVCQMSGDTIFAANQLIELRVSPRWLRSCMLRELSLDKSPI